MIISGRRGLTGVAFGIFGCYIPLTVVSSTKKRKKRNQIVWHDTPPRWSGTDRSFQSFSLIPSLIPTSMSFFQNIFKQRKIGKLDTEGRDRDVQEEEEEGLLGGARRDDRSPSPDKIGLKTSSQSSTKSRLIRGAIVVLIVLVALVVFRTHGSPIAVSGLVSLKAPGCFSDYRGKPLMKVPIAGKFRGQCHEIDVLLNVIQSSFRFASGWSDVYYRFSKRKLL